MLYIALDRQKRVIARVISHNCGCDFNFMCLFLFGIGGLSVRDNQQLKHVSQRVENHGSATDRLRQYDGAERGRCDSATDVGTRHISSYRQGQTQSDIEINTPSVCQCPVQCPADEDMEIDGPPAEDLPALHNPDLESEPFDFRSTDGDSYSSISLRTDENSIYDSVLSPSSNGMRCISTVHVCKLIVDQSWQSPILLHNHVQFLGFSSKLNLTPDLTARLLY